ncbi:class I tRNA ligase family protein, partial [Erythrobacter sp.]|uniref:class I tRNA ligase family protein n=1 Tax=Erythrobacter sp. TaxID=1042 RepID=UPI002EC19C46|nr:class I tRNA ligase family protein [Erythrobacter sp.]
MSDQKRDLKDTVFLPKTDFPMKAGLPQKEPGIQARWAEIDLYAKLREARAGREKFILHDGPPYANGEMHIGHALNHILKDMVVRSQSLMGKDAPYVPGWDCHGLPIEWKVEEQYRKKKLNKDDVPRSEFRAECRAYAQAWVDVQRGQLKRLGLLGDWDNPYLTMDFEAEGTIVAELMKFAEAGNLYRGAKPVMWSPVEKTALAEAEVEYEDITSTQIDVAFEIVESPIPELVGAHAVIWTTTPWTIPVNQALAYGPEVEYVLVEYERPAHNRQDDEPGIEDRTYYSRTKTYRILLARELISAFFERAEKSYDVLAPRGAYKLLWQGKGSDLAGTLVAHPMARRLDAWVKNTSAGSDCENWPGAASRWSESQLANVEFFSRLRPLLPGDFVTTDSGTGLVHMAPDHGEDDFDLCKSAGIHPVFAVMDDGRYRDDWPWLGAGNLDAEGKERRRAVINANFNAPDGPICSDLRQAGALLSASADYHHSYPHSWRSKAKVIYRCTPQWFVPMDK